ncbi:MAG: hypothetical protein PWP03_252 [Candidatus Woesearchaeota archaeon]|nr:hypothetical protein [Candidatus Woesearchaeota archaeon]
MQRKNKTRFATLTILVLLLILIILQIFQILGLSLEIRTIKVRNATISTADYISGPTSSNSTLQHLLEKITPTGTPDYGSAARVSYDNVEEGLQILARYAALSLTSDEQQRYDEIANAEETSCKYCCDVTKLAQNCGCSHNIALQGLVKWLIKNTNYSNKEILQEIKKWQTLFFPKPTLQEELRKRNITLEYVGLPSIVGEC